MALDPERDYPLGSRRPDLVRPPTGRALADLALESDISAADLRATPDTLRLQAEVARAPGRSQLADNLVPAGGLAGIPEGTCLGIDAALRPRGASAEELEVRPAGLDDVGAPANAAFVREA